MNEELLPNKLSELILVALRDLKAAIVAGHAVDMDVWVREVSEGHCAVCLAGAVMVQRFGVKTEILNCEVLSNEKFYEGLKFRAIDLAREGLVDLALWCLYGDCIRTDLNRSISPYMESCPNNFYEDMEQLAADLAAVGL